MPKEHDPMIDAKGNEAETPQGPQNWKERIYERLRMPLWILDLIIALLVALFVVVVLLGIAHGNSN